MKKKTLLIGLAGAAVAALAFVLFSGDGASVEKLVTERLAQTPISAEKVEFAPLGKTLTLTNVNLAWTFADMTITSHADRVELKGFNPACLDSVAPGSKLAEVASKIEITGLTSSGLIPASGDRPESKSSGAIASMTLTDYSQNLGSLIDLYAQSGWSEEFLTESYRYMLGGMIAKDYQAVSTIPDPDTEQPINMTITAKAYGLLEKAGAPDGNVDAGRLMSFYEDNCVMKVGDREFFTLGRMEVEKFLMPTPRGIIEIEPLFANLLNFDPYGDVDDILDGLADFFALEYSQKAVYARLTLKDLVVTPLNNPGRVQLARFNHTLAMGDVFDTALTMEKLDIPVEALPEEAKALLEKFGLKTLPLDFSLGVNAKPQAAGESSLKFGASLRGFGSLEASARGLLQVEELYELLDVDNFNFESALLVAGGNVKYVDSGLAALMLCIAAQEEGTAPADLLAEMRGEIARSMRDLPKSQSMKDVRAAVEMMLSKPGTVEVLLDMEKNPVALQEFAFGIILGAIPFEVKYVPGKKDIMDYIPASLR